MTCLSTAEAEYVAATEAAKELIWLRNLLTELGLAQPNPSILHEDNQACVHMATNRDFISQPTLRHQDALDS